MKVEMTLEMPISLEPLDRLGRFISFEEEMSFEDIYAYLELDKPEDETKTEAELLHEAIDDQMYPEMAFTGIMTIIDNSEGLKAHKEKLKEKFGDLLNHIPNWDLVGMTGQEMKIIIGERYLFRTNGIWAEVEDLETASNITEGTLDFEFYDMGI